MASSTLQNFEQLGYRPPGLSMHTAKATQVIGDAVATRTLTIKESGATCLFDSASGVVYTLPPPGHRRGIRVHHDRHLHQQQPQDHHRCRNDLPAR